ncbi:hypothetical protein GCM10010247_58690 [Streptomyces calvus]|nr:hypothetical protein GCM10010247_58690 [Streptomyces calvus]
MVRQEEEQAGADIARSAGRVSGRRPAHLPGRDGGGYASPARRSASAIAPLAGAGAAEDRP